MKDYVQLNPQNKEDLDKIQRGDLVLFNEEKRPFRVICTTENFILTAQKFFGQWWYSVVDKRPSDYSYNLCYPVARIEGYPYRGPDNWVFGAPDFDYDFDNLEECQKYLDTFENDDDMDPMNVDVTRISERRGETVMKISYKKGGWINGAGNNTGNSAEMV